MLVDLKATRFNPRKYRKIVVDKELHRKWKEQTGKKESFMEFKRVWIAIANAIRDSIKEEQDGVRLPGLGDFYIGYIPNHKRRGIDYKLSVQTGKTVYHENWHSDGREAKLIFATRGRPYMFREHYLWSFVPCRPLKKFVSQAILEQPEKYKMSQERFPTRFKDNESIPTSIPSQESTEDSEC